MVRGKQTKREGDNGKGIERHEGFLLKSFRYVLGQFRELLSPDQCLKEQGIYMRSAFFCIMAERTKPSIHVCATYAALVSLPSGTIVRGTQRQFSENICSEDDLRSRIFGTFVVKFLACLPLLGFSTPQKMV